MKFKLGIIKLSFVNKVRFLGRIINSSHFRTIASQQGVPKKSDLYKNHSFVVNLGLLHIWKFKLAFDEQQQKRVLLFNYILKGITTHR